MLFSLMASSLDGYASTSKEIRSIISVDKKREPNKKRRKNPKPRHLSSYGKKKTTIQPSETETKSKGKSVSLKTDSDVETKSKGKRVSLKTDLDAKHMKKKNTSSKEQHLVLKEPVPENLPIIPQFMSVQINDSQDRTKNVKNPEGGNFGFEQCVKIIRQLECSGHLETSFRQKFLTWFSLKATTHEIKVVKTFIHSLKDDPMALAEQFIDIFSNCVPRKGSAIGDYDEGGSSGALSKKSRH